MSVPQLVSCDRPHLAAAFPPDPCPGSGLLTVTAHAVQPGAVVITVRGEVDLFTSPLLRERLLAHLHDTSPQLIVDLSGVSFFGVAGLTILVAVREVAAGFGLCVVAHTRAVLMPLMITGLDGAFDVYPDLAQALLRVGGGPDR